MKKTLQALFKKWDLTLGQIQAEEKQAGVLSTIKVFELKIVGQVALLLNELPIEIAATRDIDIFHHLPYAHMKSLAEAFLKTGLILESDQNLIWMPENTTYHPLYLGKLVKVYYADVLDVMTSKAKYNRSKDKGLLQEFFKMNPDAKGKIRKRGIKIDWIESKK